MERLNKMPMKPVEEYASTAAGVFLLAMDRWEHGRRSIGGPAFEREHTAGRISAYGEIVKLLSGKYPEELAGQQDEIARIARDLRG